MYGCLSRPALHDSIGGYCDELNSLLFRKSAVFHSIAEKVTVGVITAVAIAFFWWGWSQMQSMRFGLPAGVIILTQAECGSLGSGWTRFSDADGRFVVGAGKGSDSNGVNRSFVTGEVGGEYEVTLDVDQIPKHNHSIRTGYGFDEHDGLAGVAAGGSDETGIYQDFYNPPPGALEGRGHGVLPLVISNTGENKPHQNMPPFLALNLCISS
jgi:microcystin-dependent protein